MAVDMDQIMNAVDESARRQHAHLQTAAGDFLANMDRVLTQVAALGVYRNAELSRLQQIAGPGISTIDAKVTQHGNDPKDASSESAAPAPGHDGTGPAPSVPPGESTEAACAVQNVQQFGRRIALAAAIGTAIAAGTIGGLIYTLWPAPTPSAQQAGSLYQYLEDQDAHLPP